MLKEYMQYKNSNVLTVKGAGERIMTLPVGVNHDCCFVPQRKKGDAFTAFKLHRKVKKILMPDSRRYISRIFINILENGVSFSPDTGVIRISMEEREGKVHIRIFNEEPAIAENDLEKIFCRFYSSRLEDKDLHPGLGLAIVRTITESYGGEVKAKNVQGGVLFTVSFPKPLV